MKMKLLKEISVRLAALACFGLAVWSGIMGMTNFAMACFLAFLTLQICMILGQILESLIAILSELQRRPLTDSPVPPKVRAATQAKP